MELSLWSMEGAAFVHLIKIADQNMSNQMIKNTEN